MKNKRVECVMLMWLLLSRVSSAKQVEVEGKVVASNVGVQVAVAAPQGPVHLGQPIMVTATVTNTKTQIVPWRVETSDTAYEAFHYELTVEGRAVEKTAFHRMLWGQQLQGDPVVPPNQSSILFYLAPNEHAAYTVDLTRLYKVTTPGTYLIRAVRVASDEKSELSSKAVSFTVVR